MKNITIEFPIERNDFSTKLEARRRVSRETKLRIPQKAERSREKQMTVVEQANTFTPRYTFASGWRVWRVADPMPQTFKELEEDTGEGG